MMAKVAMDIDAKHVKNNIAKWTYDDVKTKLWEITPLSKMWGIGSRMESNLNKLGLKKLATLPNMIDINLKISSESLVKSYGIMQMELIYLR